MSLYLHSKISKPKSKFFALALISSFYFFSFVNEAEATISFINSAINSSSPTTATTVTLPSGMLAGDLILVATGVGDTASNGMTVSTSGYTRVPGVASSLYANTTADVNLDLYYKIHNGSDTTVAFNAIGGTNASNAAVVMVFRGVHTVTPFDTNANTVTGTASATANPPSHNWSGTSGVWTVLAAGVGHTGGNTTTGTFPTGYTTGAAQIAHNDTTDVWVGMGYKTSPADPDDPGTITPSPIGTASADSWAAVTMSLNFALVPTVTTQDATSIGQTSATFNGNLTNNNGATSTVRGFAWGTSSTMNGDTATTTDTAGAPFSTGAFTDSSQTLLPCTTYYYRPYAVNSIGTSTAPISNSFTTSCPSIGGTVYSSEGGSNIGLGVNINLYKNGSTLVGTDATDASGVYSISGEIVSGDILTAYIDGHATNGVTVLVSDGTSKSDVHIYGSVLAVRDDVDGTITNADLATAVVGADTADMLHSTGGSKLYTIGDGGITVDEYDLSLAWDVTTASYLQEISVAAKETVPEGVFFRPDGLKMYTVGRTGQTVDEYDLSLAWDVTTAVYLQEISVAAKETIPSGVFFRADGLKMYTTGIAGDSVDEYDLSLAWDVTTAVYLQEFSLATKDGTNTGVYFRADGLKMYTIGSDGDSVDEYDLSSAWNVTTAVYLQEFSVVGQMSSPEDVLFRSDGLKMYTVDKVSDTIYEYGLSLAWDVTSASYLQELSVTSKETNPRGIFFGGINVVVASNAELHVWTGDTFTPGATVTTQGTGDLHLDDSSTATLGSVTVIADDIIVDTGSTLNINASTNINGGALTTSGTATITYSGTPTLTMSGTGALGGGSNALTFYNLTISSTGVTTGSNSMTINNALNVNTSGSLILSGGTATVATTGWSITNAGTLTFSGLTISETPTVQPASSFSVGGALTVNASKTLAPTAGSITMTGGSIVNNNSLTFYNLGIAGTVTTSSTFGVANNMTLTSGTLTTSGGTITVTGDLSVAGAITGTGNINVNGGDVTGNGTVNLTSGTFLVDGVGNFGGDTGWIFDKLTFGNGSGTETTTSSGTGSISSATTTIAVNQTLDAGSKTWTLSASFEPFQLLGSLLANSSTFKYTGSGNATVTPATYYNLELSPSSGSPTYKLGTNTGQTVVVGGDLTLAGAGNVTLDVNTYDPILDTNGSLTIGDGDTFSASDSASCTLAGNYTDNNSTASGFTHNNGTFTLDSEITATISSVKDMSFYNLNITTPGKTVQFKYHTAEVPTFNFDGQLTITGERWNNIRLRSDLSSSQWLVNFIQPQTNITFASLLDSACKVGSLSVTSNGTNSGEGNNGSCWNLFNLGANGNQVVTSVELGSGGGNAQSGGGHGGGSGGVESGSGGGTPQGGGGQGGGGGTP